MGRQNGYYAGHFCFATGHSGAPPQCRRSRQNMRFRAADGRHGGQLRADIFLHQRSLVHMDFDDAKRDAVLAEVKAREHASGRKSDIGYPPPMLQSGAHAAWNGCENRDHLCVRSNFRRQSRDAFRSSGR